MFDNKDQRQKLMQEIRARAEELPRYRATLSTKFWLGNQKVAKGKVFLSVIYFLI